MFQRLCALGFIAALTVGFSGAFAAVGSLPAVNIGRAGISARAAFGLPAVALAKDGDSMYGTYDAAMPAALAAAPLRGDGPTDLVAGNYTLPPEPMPAFHGSAPVSRPSFAPAVRAPVAAPNIPKFASVSAAPSKPDILSPKRPDNDLWAQNTGNASRPVIARTAAVLVPVAPSDDDDAGPYNFAGTDADSGIAPPPAVFADNAMNKPSLAPVAQSDDAVAPVRVAAAPAPKVPSIADTLAANRITAPTARAASFTIGTIRPQPKIQVADNTIPTVGTIRPAEIVTSRVVVPMDDIVSYNVPKQDDVVAKNMDDVQAQKQLIAQNDDDVPLSKLSPLALKRAFEKTYISENKHLSTYKINDQFDVASDMNTQIQGFDSSRDLSEAGGVRPLEIKMSFRGDDAALSRDNFNLLSEYAGIVSNNPKRAIQVSIPERATRSYDGRKLAAKRLAIISQVLHDTGVADQRIIPVLSSRSDDAFVLSIISNDTFQTLTQQQRDMFGDTVSSKTYKSMTW